MCFCDHLLKTKKLYSLNSKSISILFVIDILYDLLISLKIKVYVIVNENYKLLFHSAKI